MAATGTARRGVDGVRPHHGGPVDVALPQLGDDLRTLQHDDLVGPVGRQLDGGVDHRLVGDDTGRLDAARGGDDDLRPGVVDADGELGRGEAAEHHRVDSADPCAGQHRDHGLGDHRHVDDDPVALLDAEVAQHAGEAGDLLQQLGVGVRADGAGDRGVVDQRRLVGTAGDDVPVEGVVAGVEHAAGEPAVERRGVVVEDPLRRRDPVDAGRRVAPEPARVGQAAAVGLEVGARGGPLGGSS